MTALEQDDYLDDYQSFSSLAEESEPAAYGDGNGMKKEAEEASFFHPRNMEEEIPEEIRDYFYSRYFHPEKNFKQSEGRGNFEKNSSDEWISSIYEANRERLSGEGFSSPHEWLSYLARVDEELSKNPEKVLSELARAYGVSPSFLNGSHAPSAGKNDGRQQAAAAYARHIQSLQRYRQANEILNSFVSKCDERGDSCCPYFQNVRMNMADLLERGLAENLEEAYEKASWLNGQTRRELLRHETEKALKEKAQEARKAKEAALSIKGKAKNEVDFKNLSTREMLELQFQNLNDF